MTRSIVTRLGLVLGLLAASLGAFVARDTVTAEPAGAAVVAEYNNYVIGMWNDYHVRVREHDNAVLELDVFRYNQGMTQYLGHEVHAETYSFACFWVTPGTRNVSPAKIYVDATAEHDVQSCASPALSGYPFCLAEWVAWWGTGWVGGTWGSMNPNCPYTFPTGNLAYGSSTVLDTSSDPRLGGDHILRIH